MQQDESLALLDTILETAPIGLGFWDLELRCVRSNQALAEVLPGLLVPMTADLQTVLRTGEPILNREVSGKTHSYYPVRRSSGELLGVVAMVADPSRSSPAEILSRVAHDLKNPLTTVKLKVSSVVRSASRDTDVRLPHSAMDKLQVVEEQVDRMVRIVDSLLERAPKGRTIG